MLNQPSYTQNRINCQAKFVRAPQTMWRRKLIQCQSARRGGAIKLKSMLVNTSVTFRRTTVAAKEKTTTATRRH